MFTPGPWKAYCNPGRQPTTWSVGFSGVGHEKTIAEIPSYSTTSAADARLIAAAPEMLKELEKIRNELAMPNTYLIELNAVIAKAKSQ